MYQLTLIQFPSKKFGFVGSGPVDLFYTMPDGSVPAIEYVKDQERLPGNYRTIRAKVWDSAADAIQCATDLGCKFETALGVKY